MHRHLKSFGILQRERTIMKGSWKILIMLTIFLHHLEGKPCRYWCKTEENHFYCCPSGHPEESEEKKSSLLTSKNFWIHLIESIIHWHNEEQRQHHEEHIPESNCPPVRSVCPKSWNLIPPKICKSDEICGPWEKCCFDICLDHKVCKPSE